MASVVVGRDAELASIGDFVAGISDEASALVLEGEAGMGKTTLFREGVDVAEAAGLRVVDPAEAASWADVVMVLTPDEGQGDLYREKLGPNLKPGAALAFAHGLNVHFNLLDPRPDIDVFMIAPKGPGHTVRSEYQRGGGVPCLVAVAQNPSGNAQEIALSYASAIGVALFVMTLVVALIQRLIIGRNK